MSKHFVGWIQDYGSNNIIGAVVYDSASNRCENYTMYDLYKALNTYVEVENIKFEDGNWVGTNGLLGRYPVREGNAVARDFLTIKIPIDINNMKMQTLQRDKDMMNKSPAVVLAITSLEPRKYLIANYMGIVIEVTEQVLIDYTKEQGLANGKLVDGHISSIAGSYSLAGMALAEKQKEKLGSKIKKANMLGGNGLSTIDSNGVIHSFDGLVRNGILRIPEGVTGISEEAYETLKLEEPLQKVYIPVTMSKFTRESKKQFFGLETKELILSHVDGNLAPMTFLGCKVEKIVLPGEVRSLLPDTFRGVRGLKVIEVGPGFRPIASTWPRGVKMDKRRLVD